MSDGHGELDPMSHVPPPSFWPLITTLGLAAVLGSAALALGGTTQPLNWGLGHTAGTLLGSVLLLAGLMGWCHQIIVEKRLSHDIIQQQRDLKLFLLLFLLGELIVFLAIFCYFYFRRVTNVDFAPPSNLTLGGPLVAFATFLLLSSSVTCEFAHHALLHRKRMQARILLLATLALGVVFLGFQGYEYGELIEWGFWPGAIGERQQNAYAAMFYISTGFHGVHVLTGLVMLFLVWLRLELGHFSQQRHFSFIAASWYWHFVDIIWVALFITLYVI